MKRAAPVMLKDGCPSCPHHHPPLSTNPLFLFSLFFFFFTSSHRFGTAARTDGAYILSLALLFFFSIQKGSVSHPACVQSRGDGLPDRKKEEKMKVSEKTGGCAKIFI
jgi:hypothetical protein